MSTLFARGKAMVERVWDVAITETVSLLPRGPGDTYPTTIAGLTAIRRVLDKKDARVQQGLVAAGTIVFHLQVATLAGHVARQHDKLVDANGLVYLIDDARLETWDSRWRCETTKAV